MADQQPVSDRSPLLEEWKKTIDVQMHFNDLIMRNRQILMTAVLAVFGAAAFSLQFPNLILDIWSWKFHAAASIILFGLGLLLSMFFLDYRYYFQLLLGSVARGEAIEKMLQEQSSNQVAGLTLAISKAVDQKRARRSLCWFYAIPFLLGALFLVFVLVGYPSTGTDMKTKPTVNEAEPAASSGPPKGRK
jgi:hypothetical protein